MKILLFLLCFHLQAEPSPRTELLRKYHHSCTFPSDIQEHLPVLRRLASQCPSIVEIGLRTMISSWSLLLGLSENLHPHRSYIGIDIVSPSPGLLDTAKRLAEATGTSFQFWEADDMTVDIESTDLLFIDSLHTYCHLTYELEKFSPKTTKYIAMHDTSDPWGTLDAEYRGDFSEYPPHFDRTKRGLWPAVEDFLKRHPEWKLQERRYNNHGLTILKRVRNAP